MTLLGGDGLTHKFDCYSFEFCQWNNLPSLPEKLRFATLTTLWNYTNVLIGGEKDPKNLSNSVMSLDNKAWTLITHLVKPVSRHCTVVVKEDTIYIIGGLTETSLFSKETISFDTLTKTTSTIEAKMNRGRQLHCCAMLNRNHIIVVGGRDARGALKSAETLDTSKSNKWIENKNLELPHGISYAQLVVTKPLGKCVSFF